MQRAAIEEGSKKDFKFGPGTSHPKAKKKSLQAAMPGPIFEGTPGESGQGEMVPEFWSQARASDRSLVAENGSNLCQPNVYRSQPYRGGTIMLRIVNHFDNHAEIWGAVLLGVCAIASCVAMAAAFNGAL
jgi:hypothetical protein